MQSIDNNIQAFFALVRGGLWETDVRLSQYDNVAFSQVLKLAKEQSVVGLIAAGLEHVVDFKVHKADVLQFAGQALQLEQQNLAMNFFIKKLIERLKIAGIYTLLVKGQGIAQCYERPLWRACGDVDLFLSKDNYEKSKQLLAPLATTIDKEWKHAQHLGMTIDSWVVELHGYLPSGLSPRIDRVIDEAQRGVFYGGNVRSWLNGNTTVFLPGVDEDVIFVFTHFLRHFYKGGIGARQICDWCRLLWTYRDKIDLRLLERRIRQAGLMSEWRAFGAFAVEYLGMPGEAMPFYSAEKKWERKASRICDFIIAVGNFGHNRDMSYYQNKPYVIRKAISLYRRCKDIVYHTMLFPLDSLRFFPYIIFNGLRSTVRGE